MASFFLGAPFRQRPFASAVALIGLTLSTHLAHASWTLGPAGSAGLFADSALVVTTTPGAPGSISGFAVADRTALPWVNSAPCGVATARNASTWMPWGFLRSGPTELTYVCGTNTSTKAFFTLDTSTGLTTSGPLPLAQQQEQEGGSYVGETPVVDGTTGTYCLQNATIKSTPVCRLVSAEGTATVWSPAINGTFKKPPAVHAYEGTLVLIAGKSVFFFDATNGTAVGGYSGLEHYHRGVVEVAFAGQWTVVVAPLLVSPGLAAVFVFDNGLRSNVFSGSLSGSLHQRALGRVVAWTIEAGSWGEALFIGAYWNQQITTWMLLPPFPGQPWNGDQPLVGLQDEITLFDEPLGTDNGRTQCVLGEGRELAACVRSGANGSSVTVFNPSSGAVVHKQSFAEGSTLTSFGKFGHDQGRMVIGTLTSSGASLGVAWGYSDHPSVATSSEWQASFVRVPPALAYDSIDKCVILAEAVTGRVVCVNATGQA